MRIILVVAGALLLAGCVRTAASVVTAPFKVAGQAADWATTSQDEADRNYGRKMRKQEAKEARELRKRQKEAEKRRRARGDD
jgi:hypothetical protein